LISILNLHVILVLNLKLFLLDLVYAVFSLFHLTEFEFFVTQELEHIIVIRPESLTMRHSHKSNTDLLHVVVQVALDVDRHGTGALVEDGVQGSVVDEAAHGDALLFTA
jgi:hypothetical protein